ncbi:MAG: hypothetical protein P8O12_04620 [Tateyamaria sp.]|nr:hypothetical protein [Tateyamaria sp.]
MTGTLSLTLIAGHIWQGPIPSRKLQRLKSFAMTSLENFWAEDLEEYLNYRFIPYEDDWTLSIETKPTVYLNAPPSCIKMNLDPRSDRLI